MKRQKEKKKTFSYAPFSLLSLLAQLKDSPKARNDIEINFKKAIATGDVFSPNINLTIVCEIKCFCYIEEKKCFDL